MADGGNVEFVEIDGLIVKLKLAGACGSCPSSLTTMTMGIKRRLMEKIPVSCQTHVHQGRGICSVASSYHRLAGVLPQQLPST
jgi:Fe-S cluster biogenesis protein NfuA